MKKERGIDFKILYDLRSMGLVEILDSSEDKKTAKFYVTTLLQQFLVSSTGQQMVSLDKS